MKKQQLFDFFVSHYRAKKLNWMDLFFQSILMAVACWFILVITSCGIMDDPAPIQQPMDVGLTAQAAKPTNTKQVIPYQMLPDTVQTGACHLYDISGIFTVDGYIVGGAFCDLESFPEPEAYLNHIIFDKTAIDDWCFQNDLTINQVIINCIY